MSVSSSSKKEPGTNTNRPVYLQRFVMHVHRLVAAAYARIDPLGQQNTDERIITERLVQAINGVIGENGAPKWMERYHATDDRPVSYPGREGPQRPRVDIEVILCKGTRPLFHFECKRLGRGHPVRQYLGEEGLGCFLTEQYARGADEGGMLGYVQSDDCAEWASRIEHAILAGQTTYGLLPKTSWESCPIVAAIPETYWTHHIRPSMGPISIYHSLLLFHQSDDE